MRASGPLAQSSDMTLTGVYYAVVTQNQDPLGQGRVKVRLPWLDNGEAEETEWAQLAAPMEGKHFGWYALPDLGDVVIVGFVHGDIKRPVVVGGCWSKADPPPEANDDGKNNFRGFTSRSGHRLIFDDGSNVKVVFADKSTNQMLGVGKFGGGGSGPNVCEVRKPRMAGSSGVSLVSSDGTLAVSCPKGKLTVKAGQNVKMNATTTVDVHAGSTLSLDGGVAKLTSGAVSNYAAPRVKIG